MNTLNTSRNFKPKLLSNSHFKKHLDRLKDSGEFLDLLNYGAGKYWQNVSNHLLENYPSLAPSIVAYDRFYSIGDSHYNKQLKTLVTGYNKDLDYITSNTVLCSNVLNVIQEQKEIEKVISDCLKALSLCGKAFFSIYEGDKSGKGKETRDGYQRNQKTVEYIKMFNRFISYDCLLLECFSNVIIVTKIK